MIKIAITFVVLFSGILYGQTVRDIVKYVIDGDTVQFSTMRCRLAYIDASESGDNPKAKKEARRYGIAPSRIYRAGKMAKAYTKSLLFKGMGYKIDVVKKKGKYGRSICVIYLPQGRSINEMLVADGMAVPFWRYIPSRLKREYRDLLREAQTKRLGIWRTDGELMLRLKGKQ